MKSVSVNVGKEGCFGTRVATVSDEDFDKVKSKNWHLHKKGYPVTAFKRVTGKWTNIPMHRFLLPPKEGFEIDHINRDKFDNRRENLRYVLDCHNSRNTNVRRNNKLGYKGVCIQKNRFRAAIRVNGKRKHLGSFRSPEEAYAAYVEASRFYYGEYSGV